MLVIRLARGGRSKYPVYRIVAAESSRAATGKFIEVLGHYNPHTKELAIKKEETENRLSHGAQPSNSVVKLLQREKIEVPGWVKLQEKTRKPKNAPAEPEVAPEAAAPAAEAEVAAEEPAVEAAAEAPVAETPPAVETPAVEAPEEERVATAATEHNADASDDQPNENTETAESNEAQADKAEAANEAGAEVVAKATDKADSK